MTRWLYNEDGDPVAFVQNDLVFDEDSNFVGEIVGSAIWNCAYVAEIILDDRLAVRAISPSGAKQPPKCMTPVALPDLPEMRGPVLFPIEFEEYETG